MKKLILSAFCLGLGLTSVNVLASNNTSAVAVSVNNDDERKALKAEELPEAVTKALASEAYAGWTVKEAAMVTKTATAADKANPSYYEVTLSKEKETRTVKFQKDGTLLN